MPCRELCRTSPWPIGGVSRRGALRRTREDHHGAAGGGCRLVCGDIEIEMFHLGGSPVHARVRGGLVNKELNEQTE